MVNLVPSPKTATSVSSGRFGRASGVAAGAGTGAVWANTAPRLANASKQTTFIGIVLAYHGSRAGTRPAFPGEPRRMGGAFFLFSTHRGPGRAHPRRPPAAKQL